MGKIRGNWGAEKTTFKFWGTEEQIFYAREEISKMHKPVRNEGIIRILSEIIN